MAAFISTNLTVSDFLIKVAKKGANVFRTARCSAIPGVNRPCTLLDPPPGINIASSKKCPEAMNVASEVKITMGYRNIKKSAKLIDIFKFGTLQDLRMLVSNMCTR